MREREMTGRGVIITGGAGGVGSTVSLRWLDAGADVLVVDHRQETIDKWKSELAPPGNLSTFACDVSTESGARAMVAEAAQVFRRDPDTLIHLVGGFAMGKFDSDDSASTWDRMMSINLSSAYHCYRAMLPHLKSRKGGWIVGLSSRAARLPSPGMVAYAASKAALGSMTISLAAEVRSLGIHVNLIVASTIDTAANRQAMGDAKAGDWVTADDIADATMFLCSERAKSVHGATLEVFANS
jgi:NAD(P)-dependent dehydrogenase (short-subunit alcohol dehydrogenase family)